MTNEADALDRFLLELLEARFPDLDLRVIRKDDTLTVRYAAVEEGRRGRRFLPLFRLRREAEGWSAHTPSGESWVLAERRYGLLHKIRCAAAMVE